MTDSTINNDIKHPNVVTGSFSCFDPDHLYEVVADAQLEHTLLESGHFQGNWLQANINNRNFSSANYNLSMHAQGTLAKEYLTLSMQLHSSGECIANGIGLRSNSLVIAPENIELDYHLAKNSNWVALEVKREEMQLLGITCLPENSLIMQTLSSKHEKYLRREFIDTKNILRQINEKSLEIYIWPGIYSMLYDNLISTLADALDSLDYSTSTSWKKRYRLVKKAESIMFSNPLEDFSLMKLCKELNISLRKLELAFQHIYGMSPKHFLNLRKLNKLRQKLINNTPESTSVTQASIESGFFHLGRLSIYYKKMYGELPSITLKNRSKILLHITSR